MVAQRYPALHPDVVFKEHILDGRALVRAFRAGRGGSCLTFTPQNWQFARLFDGQRIFEKSRSFTQENRNRPISASRGARARETSRCHRILVQDSARKEYCAHAENRRRTAEAALNRKRNGATSHSSLSPPSTPTISGLASRANRVLLHLVVHSAYACCFCLSWRASLSRTGVRSAVTPCSSSTLPTRAWGTSPCSGVLATSASCPCMRSATA